MSGIAGIHKSNQTEFVANLLENIQHRGTSKPSILETNSASIGAIHIKELAEVAGPVSTQSNSRAIIWDGKLMNKDSLLPLLHLRELESGSDAEVVLHLYEELGTNAFDQMEGEYALAIMDDAEIVLARDRLGIKPLYFGFQGKNLCFGSEIKSLIDQVEDIREFPPGHYMISNQGMYPYRPYMPKPISPSGATECAELLAEFLLYAIPNYLPPNVPIGVWLSGGVDSSVITALADRYVDKLHTFSVGVEGSPDLEHAKEVAEFLGTEHHERVFDLDDMLDVLDEVIYHLESFDAPLVRSAIANYLVAELASEHVPLVLSGEGGDELFAGYAYQKEFSSELELTLSVQDAISSLHNTALQRVDRSAAAHGTRAAVPFLNPEVYRFAMAIPSRWKIRGPQAIDKWPLRSAMKDSLPESISWRNKVKFWQGVGSEELLKGYAEEEIKDRELYSMPTPGRIDGIKLGSKEEMMYYLIYKKFFGGKVTIDEIGRTLYI